MKKLQVKTADGWHFVFCRRGADIVLTDTRAKALPTKALWGHDDLASFRAFFPEKEFRLWSDTKRKNRRPNHAGAAK